MGAGGGRRAADEVPAVMPQAMPAPDPSPPPPSRPDALPPEPSTERTAGDVALAALASSVALLERHQAGLATDPEPVHVHQARVALRRLRSDLRTFRPLFVRPWADDLARELAWLAAELGGVRDADVLALRLRGRLADLAPEHRFAAEPLLEVLDTRRARTVGHLTDALGSHRFHELRSRLAIAARTPPCTGAAASPAEEIVPRLTRRPWRRLRTQVEELGRHPDDEALHETRILVKRCRYAVAAVTPVVGRRARELAAALRRLQDRLGEHQDAVVTSAWLQATALRSDAPTAFVAGMLAETEERAAARAREAWRPAWKRARKARLR